MPSGGGGGGGSSFSAQGAPPGFDYSTAMGLQQLAIGGDIQGYALSDQDFANRYPGLQDAYNQWQSNLGAQVGQVAQGGAGQGQILSGLGSQILGRQGTQTTGDINAVRNAARTAAGAAQPMMNLAGSQAGLAQPLVGLGQQQAGLAQPLIGLGQQQAGLAGGLIGMGRQQAGIGQGITQMGGQLAGAAQQPYQIGQQLLNQPIDPQVQQQMMRAGLSSASGALGAASLGQGMAGQAAAARQLGLNTMQYGQQRRAEAMGDINQYASMLGAAGQMQGLGAQTIGQGGQTIGLGGNQLTAGGALIGAGGQQLTGGGALIGAGGGMLGQAAQTYGGGAQAAATAGGLSGAAQGLQEAYGMNTAQMANMYGQLQNQQAAQMLGGISTAGQMFQKRPFGLGGSNLAQSELGQTGAYNSFQQANYATMNGIAFNSAQMQAQQQQLQAQQSAGMMSAGVGAAGAVASAASAAAAASAMTCWVARECLGTADSRWKQFRLWLLNYAPGTVRRLYLVHGQAFAKKLSKHRILRATVRTLMEAILKTQGRRCSLLILNNLLCA